MKYLALIYAAPNAGPAHGTPEFGEFMGGYMAATQRYKADNVLIAGEGLKATSTATTDS